MKVRRRMTVLFKVSEVFPISPLELYDAWLDAQTHSEMTGSPTEISAEAVTSFSAGDGYIQGVNLELEPGKRILQRWRTTDFSEDDEDSIVEILLEEAGDGTRLTIIHSNLPEDGMQYQDGWVKWYFTPMKRYFSP